MRRFRRGGRRRFSRGRRSFSRRRRGSAGRKRRSARSSGPMRIGWRM